MPAAGCARLESAAIEIEAGSPEARLNQPGLYVRIRFTVSGEELDQAALSRIFEPFAIKSSGHGTGLGLSIAHSIVIQSGGSITASSVKERGTSFEILLPSIGAFHGIAEVRGGCGRAARDIVPTLLLVEDEDSVRRLVRGYLEGAGYQLLEARNAEDAELIAKVYREPIHLLVTDVVMPGMTGSELAERLAPLRPLMKVLLISGYRHDTLERHGLDRDETVLAKPFPAPELLRRVRALLGREANAE
jgi:CheY-like chemotaxis protein